MIDGWLGFALVLCSAFGYGFWLGWWARTKKMDAQQRLLEALSGLRIEKIQKNADGSNVEITSRNP